MPGYEIHRLSGYWLVPLALLSAAPELRIFDVQVVEVLQLARVALVALLVARCGFRLPVEGVWVRFGRGYLFFFATSFVLALAALRLPMFTPPDLSILKGPLVISVARLLELLLDVYLMLAVADSLVRDRVLLRKSLDVYVGIAVGSAVLSIAAYIVLAISGQYLLFVYAPADRVRGFFNEGGPYGVYLVSALLLAGLRVRLFRPARRWMLVPAVAVLLVALLLSASKAGILTLIACCLSSTLALSLRRRLALATVLLGLAAAFVFGFQSRFQAYLRDITNFDEAVLDRPDDINLIMGRVVAVLIIPRMIDAHPLTGIGIGNYSLMRNDPDYLQGLPVVADWDLPGLGLVSVAAELGIPLAMYLVGLLLKPALLSYRRKAAAALLAASTFQPCAALVGVNLNFFYPWLVTGFVLAVLIERPDNAQMRQR